MSYPYKYTLGFIYCPETNQTLLLNRQKAPWMGRWNGVGGKLVPKETPYACIVRETLEETGLLLPQYQSRGVLKWYRNERDLGGVYSLTAELQKDFVDLYSTPLVYCHEGILVWKRNDWILHEENSGIVDNIKLMMKKLFEAREEDVFAATYKGNQLLSVTYEAKDEVEISL